MQEVFDCAKSWLYACLSVLALSTSQLILSVVKGWDFFSFFYNESSLVLVTLRVFSVSAVPFLSTKP